MVLSRVGPIKAQRVGHNAAYMRRIWRLGGSVWRRLRNLFPHGDSPVCPVANAGERLAFWEGQVRASGGNRPN